MNLRNPRLDLPQKRCPAVAWPRNRCGCPTFATFLFLWLRWERCPAQTTSASTAREPPSSASACSRLSLRLSAPSEQPPCEQPASASSVPVRLQSWLYPPFLVSFPLARISSVFEIISGPQESRLMTQCFFPSPSAHSPAFCVSCRFQL